MPFSSWLKSLTFQHWIFLFFVLLFSFRLFNVLNFNPYWGYDGGGHIDYTYSLFETSTIPSVEDNYIAWHEPLYYYLQAFLLHPISWLTSGLAGQLKILGVFQVFLSMTTVFTIYKISRLLSPDRRVQLFSTALLALMTGMSQASTFLTNELLNYFFIFLITYLYLLWRDRMEEKHYLYLGTFSGLALLNKITPIILIGVLGFLFIWKWVASREKKWPLLVGLLLVPVILLQIPWQHYRMTHIYETPTINNPHFLPPAPLALDGRIWFFTKFDFDIFEFPYWYSGGRAFWSMLYADSFYDYYGSIVNKDWALQAPEDALIRTTNTPTFVPKWKSYPTKALPYFALFPFAVILLGLYSMFRTLIQQFDYKSVLPVLFTLGFLAALLYFSYRYPFYDFGIVKSIFIYPMYLFPVIYGFDALMKFTGRAVRLRYVAFTGCLIYLALLIPTLTVHPYGY